MGAQQSSQAPQEQVFQSEPSTSVQFSPSLIDRLSSAAPSPDKSAKSSSSVSGSSSSSTDDIVRRRLAAESAHIRQQESEILSKISAALEKENMDKEKPRMSSQVLSRDIEEVREKVGRMKREREQKEGEGVRKAKEGVVACYAAKKDRPLDCWKEVEAFKFEVSKLEQAFVKSMQ
ncbi:uncharacterized protein MKK02DRAFT_38640 [Dioszegia hungarica]|uniref:DUF1690-domain-containing protein n=1 Tax=Dioszegia hungarica TaxID=4972 RepID=A0AA38H7U1_9TREE|nr:uncharacterized protein MKK02DRAFT_38640 [Dioszegia hungarica]KAI9633969.1 hypothetical protein MKK02DRAFT_38640 [Dioszegia hungarica]